MAEVLVPIAISSQLDVTGEERVHAANYTAVSRVPYTPPTLTILGDLPNGIEGDVISYQYTAIGGYGGNVFTISSGSLPSGLSMDTDGLVTGVAEMQLIQSWTVRVTDSSLAFDELDDTAAYLGLHGTLVDGAAGVAYSDGLDAGGGIPPYVDWTITSGTLPAGLSMSSTTGIISGTPT